MKPKDPFLIQSTLTLHQHNLTWAKGKQAIINVCYILDNCVIHAQLSLDKSNLTTSLLAPPIIATPNPCSRQGPEYLFSLTAVSPVLSNEYKSWFLTRRNRKEVGASDP